MPQLIFVLPDGSQRVVEAQAGLSIMNVASMEGIPGIVAECGGGAMCATCHVYIDDEWIDKIPPADDGESDMLDCTTAERRSGSRLSCQVTLADSLDGMTVHVPERQR